jgi:Asp-tRNA(Asn)/Glu-tRNA(Gln) amidotransferase A subunit family amidase
MEHPTYHRRPVKAPRLTGNLLRILCRLVELPIIGRWLALKLLGDVGIDRLRAVRAHRDDSPLSTHFVDRRGPAAQPAPVDWRDWSTPTPLSPAPPSAADLTDAYRSGDVTPTEVAERFCTRLEASELGETPLRTLIAHRRDDLLEQAAASDRRWAEGRPLGPLDGVPVAVKDEIDVRGYSTTAGTAFLDRGPAERDGHCVAALRRCGALLVGKANMHELGIGVTGLNPHHGSARNPHDARRAAGGSSSGSAAIVAAGLVPLAIGADGGGSIRIPAAFCGVVGLKPTFGRISEDGVEPLCWSVGHVGPIGATTADVALGLAGMAGPDPADPASLEQPQLDLRDWHEGDLSGVRLGVYSAWLEDADGEVVAAARSALDTWVRAGAHIVEISLPDPDVQRIAHLITIASEMLAGQQDLVEVRARYGLDVRLNFALIKHLSAADFVHAQRIRHALVKSMREVFTSIDALITPTTGCAAPPLAVKALAHGESDIVTLDTIMRFAVTANLTGQPAISMPSGNDAEGLPLGVQAMARPWDERLLLRLSHHLEREVAWQRPKAWFGN